MTKSFSDNCDFWMSNLNKTDGKNTSVSNNIVLNDNC